MVSVEPGPRRKRGRRQQMRCSPAKHPAPRQQRASSRISPCPRPSLSWLASQRFNPKASWILLQTLQVHPLRETIRRHASPLVHHASSKVGVATPTGPRDSRPRAGNELCFHAPQQDSPRALRLSFAERCSIMLLMIAGRQASFLGSRDELQQHARVSTDRAARHGSMLLLTDRPTLYRPGGGIQNLLETQVKQLKILSLEAASVVHAPQDVLRLRRCGELGHVFPFSLPKTVGSEKRLAPMCSGAL